jgi:hypothetical protein
MNNPPEISRDSKLRLPHDPHATTTPGKVTTAATINPAGGERINTTTAGIAATNANKSCKPLNPHSKPERRGGA